MELIPIPPISSLISCFQAVIRLISRRLPVCGSSLSTSSGSVSYTHLDVYKRQAWLKDRAEKTVFQKQEIELNNTLEEAFDICLSDEKVENLHEGTTVDVYKRQRSFLS